MAGRPQQITISLSAQQSEQLEEIIKLTKADATQIFRSALVDYYEKIMNDQDAKEKAMIDALLDVQ